MIDNNRRVTTIGGLAARCIFYTLMMSGVALLPAIDIATNPFDREILFAEFSFVQWAQNLTLVIGLVVTGYLYCLNVLPQLSLLFASLLMCALVRETDTFLDSVADGLWQTLVLVILVGTGSRLIRNRQALKAQIAWLGNQFGLGLMLAGFVIIMGFARIFGRGEMWQQIMGDHYTKTIKYFAEESVELMGYVILAIGIVEFSIAAIRHFRRAETRRHQSGYQLQRDPTVHPKIS